MDGTVSFVVSALALTGSPGPNTLSLAAVGASFGPLRGIRYMLGLYIGMVAVIGIVGAGIASMILAVPGIVPVITVAAIVYFAYLAYRIATAPPLTRVEGPHAAPRWYEGTVLSLINPKAYVAMAALFSGHVLVEGDNLADTLWKAGLALATLCTVNVFWLAFGAGLTRFCRNARVAKFVNWTFAALLLGSVAIAVL